MDLIEPVLPEWAVGRIQLAYDNNLDRIVIVADEVGAFDPDDPSEVAELAPDLGNGRIGLSRPQAAAIARRGAELMQSGRPLCNLCGNPMDPEGHSCPRTNGQRQRTP